PAWPLSGPQHPCPSGTTTCHTFRLTTRAAAPWWAPKTIDCTQPLSKATGARRAAAATMGGGRGRRAAAAASGRKGRSAAGRAHGLARSAVQTQRQVLDDRIGERDAALGQRLDEKDAPARRVHLRAQLGERRAVRQAEAAVHTLVHAFDAQAVELQRPGDGR